MQTNILLITDTGALDTPRRTTSQGSRVLRIQMFAHGRQVEARTDVLEVSLHGSNSSCGSRYPVFSSEGWNEDVAGPVSGPIVPIETRQPVRRGDDRYRAHVSIVGASVTVRFAQRADGKDLRRGCD